MHPSGDREQTAPAPLPEISISEVPQPQSVDVSQAALASSSSSAGRSNGVASDGAANATDNRDHGGNEVVNTTTEGPPVATTEPLVDESTG